MFDIQILFICRLRPEAIRVPECAKGEYYILRNSEDIRPYGMVVNFLTREEGDTIRASNAFDKLSPVELY